MIQGRIVLVAVCFVVLLSPLQVHSAGPVFRWGTTLDTNADGTVDHTYKFRKWSPPLEGPYSVGTLVSIPRRPPGVLTDTTGDGNANAYRSFASDQAEDLVTHRTQTLHPQELVFQDPLFSFQLIRLLGATPADAASVGESLATADRIIDGNTESWYEQWYQTAERVRNLAEKALADNHPVSARQAYLRASNYYRTAGFFLSDNPGDPRLLDTWSKSRDSFRKAAPLFSPPIQQVEIPYQGGINLPGYFYRPDDSGIARPTLIVQTGFDGTQEELIAFGAEAPLLRGYNCLTFEGPGQGAVLKEHGLPFRPDWEAVVTPVIDYLLTRSDVDPEYIVLMGISFGGYLAARAAAFEDRLAAVVLNPGIYDYFAGTTSKSPLGSQGTLMMATYFPKLYDWIIDFISKDDLAVRWAFGNGMYTFGASTPSEYMLKASKYHLNDVVDKITYPTLILDSENESFYPGQSIELFNALSCTKKLIYFTDAEGAGLHCQAGAMIPSQQRAADWVEETLDRE